MSFTKGNDDEERNPDPRSNVHTSEDIYNLRQYFSFNFINCHFFLQTDRISKFFLFKYVKLI